jgi:hypothetical protein
MSSEDPVGWDEVSVITAKIRRTASEKTGVEVAIVVMFLFTHYGKFR